MTKNTFSAALEIFFTQNILRISQAIEWAKYPFLGHIIELGSNLSANEPK